MRTLASYRTSARSASGRLRWLLPVVPLSVAMLVATVAVAQQATPPDDQPDPLDQALQQEPPADAEPSSTDTDDANQQPEPPPYLPPPEGAQRLSPTDRAWVDRDRGIVIVDGRIALRRGLLEMFACPPNTKEHESVVAVQSKAFVIHAALLAVGAEPGGPVEFSPEYKPPRGTKIEIDVLWRDQQGNQQKARAQQWVRDARTKQAMDLPWVFAGSGFWRDEQTGASGYMAEAGDLVCVANFSTAMLDVPAKLTNDNAGLLFEAYTERIPPLGWPVRLVFKPVLDEEATDQQPGESGTATEAPASDPPPSPEREGQPPQDQPPEDKSPEGEQGSATGDNPADGEPDASD